LNVLISLMCTGQIDIVIYTHCQHILLLSLKGDTHLSSVGAQQACETEWLFCTSMPGSQ